MFVWGLCFLSSLSISYVMCYTYTMLFHSNPLYAHTFALVLCLPPVYVNVHKQHTHKFRYLTRDFCIHSCACILWLCLLPVLVISVEMQLHNSWQSCASEHFLLEWQFLGWLVISCFQVSHSLFLHGWKNIISLLNSQGHLLAYYSHYWFFS